MYGFNSFTGRPPAVTNPYLAGMMQYFPSLDATVLVNGHGANVPRVLSLNAPDPGGSSPPPTSYSGVTIF